MAIKILPAHLESDPLRKRQLEREAKAISGLNHPNICVLYDVGSQDGANYLVMECLEGETLEKRLDKGPLAVEQVLKYGAQMADALGAAHRAGIVHRDLKPGNIMLTSSGTKLLDFGLAKPTVPVTSGETLTGAAPAQSLLTQAGTIVGTFQYMSPEQIECRELDGRSDIFSLGAVLYEMVTGKKAFEGKGQFSVASAILHGTPAPIRTVKPQTPALLDRTIGKCLAKVPDERWQSAGDLASELNWIAESPTTKEEKRATRTRERLAWGLAILCAGLLAWAGLDLSRGTHSRSEERRPIRLSVLPPQGSSFVESDFAISPDGRRLVFAAASQDGGTKLWIRSLDAASAQSVTGTDGAIHPFWSGDSRRIGFFASGRLKIVDPGEGQVQTLCEAPPVVGASWNKSGTILFTGFTGAIFKVSATPGGRSEPVTKPLEHQLHLWPLFLPDGEHFLFFLDNQGNPGKDAPPVGTYWGSLSSEETKLVTADISGNVQFGAGRLFFVRERSLMSQPLDLRHLTVTGSPALLAPQEMTPGIAFPRFGFSVSEDGFVVFQSANDSVSRFTWFDRGGIELNTISGLGYRDPALARSGNPLAVASDDGYGRKYIRIRDFVRESNIRVSDSDLDISPVLSPHGEMVAYCNQLDGRVYRAPVDGSEKPTELFQDQKSIPNDWSPNGRYLVYMNFQQVLFPDLKVYDFQEGARRASYFGATNAQFSPDGKWLAFSGPGGELDKPTFSDSEIYVAPFPGPGGRIQVSNHGGSQARWRADGKEIYYITPEKELMAVPVDTTSANAIPGVPHVLFKTRIVSTVISPTEYAVSPDGKRFLINSLPKVGAAPLIVIMN